MKTDPTKTPGYSRVTGLTILTLARNMNRLRIDTWGGTGVRTKDDGLPERMSLSSGTLTLSFDLDAVASMAEEILRRWMADNTVITVESHASGDTLLESPETGEKVATGPSYS